MTVVTIGEVVVDWLATEAGKGFTNARSFYRCLGGNASNVAIGLSRLGTRTRLIGKVGNDLHGHYLREILQSEGIDLRFLKTEADYPTAQCYVFTEDDGEHSFYNWPRPHAAQMLRPADVAEEALANAAFLHATGISYTLNPRKSAVQRAIELALERGLALSFDAGFPTGEDSEAQQALESALALAHILKVNRRELAFWSGGSADDPIEDQAARLFAKYQPVVLAVTLGADGAYLLTGKGSVRCLPFSVASLGGVGAGDGFIAGMLHALGQQLGDRLTAETLSRLETSEWERAGLYGNAVGALVTTRIGACEALPTASQVEELLNG